MTALAPREHPADDLEIEALIKEARWRRRRRWITRSLTAGVLAALAGGLYSAAGSTGPAPRVRLTSAKRPLVNVRAFGHNGDLAFVSRNALWVLDGSTGSLREVSADYPMAPSFSPDGNWLAYVTTGPPQRYAGALNPPPSQLWIAHANGSDPRAVHGLDLAQSISPSWSPTADTLAVIEGTFGSPKSSIALISPAGGTRLLAGTSTAGYFIWSPDGRQIAFARYARSGPGPRGALETVSIAGGAPVVWGATNGSENGTNPLTPTIPARWLPDGKGIVFWVDYQYSASIEADGLPLYLIANPDARPHKLGLTLVNSASIATSPTGQLAIADGFDRYQWTTKTVERCSTITASCTKVAIPRSKISFDPSWSPNGDQLLFTVGPNNGDGSFFQNAVSKWYAKLSLWSVAPNSATATKLGGTGGGTVSSWSPNGQSLLFEAGDALWLRTTPTSAPKRVATPLFPRDDWPTYYAEIDWSDQFAWSPLAPR